MNCSPTNHSKVSKPLPLGLLLAINVPEERQQQMHELGKLKCRDKSKSAGKT